MRTKNISSFALRRQRGFLIPLSIFIVVVMSLFALTLWRTTVQTTFASAQELVTVQAFYAAESGAQSGMSNLFFPDSSTRGSVDTRCGLLNQNLSFVGVAGLSNCTAVVTCACQNCTPAGPTSYYTIESVGRCGSGNISAVRTVRVGSFLDQE